MTEMKTLTINDMTYEVVDAALRNMFINCAGAHNSIYRGKLLGTGVTDSQWNAIAEGTFTDMYIGDYWEIDGTIYRIAAFNYYLKTGDLECVTNHITIVPDKKLYDSVMNDTANTNIINSTDVGVGGYTGSKMRIEGLESAKSLINSAFGETHILNHRQYLSTSVNNDYVNSGGWYDSTVELMTERNVYGSNVAGGFLHGDSLPNVYSVDKSQYPLFMFNPCLISNRQLYWLRDICSSTSFARVENTGLCGHRTAEGSYGVRPAFSICKEQA